MFDVKKRRIIPDILGEIRSPNGRISLKDVTIANYRFDRTVDNNIVNRSSHVSASSDLYFFDNKKSRRTISLDKDTPFKKIGKEQNYFLYQPEGYSSKILTRYNGRSLPSSHAKAASAKINVVSGSTVVGGQLSGSYLEVTGYNPSGSDKTYKYFFLENAPGVFIKPEVELKIFKNLRSASSALTYVSGALDATGNETFVNKRLGFVISTVSGSLYPAGGGTHVGNHTINYFINPDSNVTTATNRGLNYFGPVDSTIHHFGVTTTGHTIEIPHLSTDTGQDLLERIVTTINNPVITSAPGGLPHLSASFSEEVDHFKIKLKHEMINVLEEGYSEKNRWDYHSKLNQYHKAIFYATGSIQDTDLVKDFVGSSETSEDVVIRFVTGSSIYTADDTAAPIPNLSISYAGSTVDYIFGKNSLGISNSSTPSTSPFGEYRNAASSNTGNPLASRYHSSYTEDIPTSLNLLAQLLSGSTDPDAEYTGLTGTHKAGTNSLNIDFDISGPGPGCVILKKKLRNSTAKLTIDNHQAANFNNKKLVLTGSTGEKAEFIFSTSYSEHIILDPGIYSVPLFGIVDSNPASKSTIAERLKESINHVFASGSFHLNASRTGPSLELIQNLHGESGNTDINDDGTALFSSSLILKDGNFLSGSGDGVISVTGADVGNGKVVVGNLSSNMNSLNNFLPNNGDILLDGHWDGFGYIQTGNQKIGNICVRYDIGENSLYDVFKNLNNAINVNKSTGFISSSLSENENQGKKVLFDTVIRQPKSILELTQVNAGIDSNATLNLKGTSATGLKDLSSLIDGLSFTSFSGGVSKLSAASMDSRGLDYIGKKSYIFRLKTSESTNNIIFSVASDNQTRCYLSSTSGATENLYFRINSSQAGKYWDCRIDSSVKSIARGQWLTLVISVDENNPSSGIKDNYMAIFDSDNHGAMLAQKGFTPQGSPPIPVKNFTNAKNARIFVGFGDSSTAIPENFFNDASSTLDLADFHEGFKLAEISILSTCIALETAEKLAVSHRTSRSKSGFRNELPKKQLDDLQSTVTVREKNKTFVDSDRTSPIATIRDVIYPNMLPAPGIGNVTMKFDSEPNSNSFFGLLLPDESNFMVKFDDSIYDVTGVLSESVSRKAALTGSFTEYGNTLRASPMGIAPDNIQAWYRFNENNVSSNGYLTDYSGNGRHLTKNGNSPSFVTPNNVDIYGNAVPMFSNGALSFVNPHYLRRPADDLYFGNTFNADGSINTEGRGFTVSFWFHMSRNSHNTDTDANNYIINSPSFALHIAMGSSNALSTANSLGVITLTIEDDHGHALANDARVRNSAVYTMLIPHTTYIVDGRWNHVVITYDGTGQRFSRTSHDASKASLGYEIENKECVRLYVNGVNTATGTHFPLVGKPALGDAYFPEEDWPNDVVHYGMGKKTFGFPIRIANQHVSTAQNFIIGDIAIWDAPLSQEQAVALLRESGDEGNKASGVFYYDAEKYYSDNINITNYLIAGLSGSQEYSKANRDSMQASVSFGDSSVSDLSGKMIGTHAPRFLTTPDWFTQMVLGAGDGTSDIVPENNLESISGNPYYSYSFLSGSFLSSGVLHFGGHYGVNTYWHDLITNNTNYYYPNAHLLSEVGSAKWTFSFWAYISEPDTYGEYRKGIIDISNEIIIGTFRDKIFVSRCYANTNNSAYAYVYYDTSTALRDKWQNVIVTYNEQTPGVAPNVYIDGVKQSLTVSYRQNGSWPGTDAADANALTGKKPRHIAGFSSIVGSINRSNSDLTANHYFNGRIAEITAWNDVLSESTILNLYDSVVERATELREEELARNLTTFINNTNKHLNTNVLASVNSLDSRSLDIKFNIPGTSTQGFLLSGSTQQLSYKNPVRFFGNSTSFSLTKVDLSGKFEGFANIDAGDSSPNDSIIAGNTNNQIVSASIECRDISDNLRSILEMGNITPQVVQNRNRYLRLSTNNLADPIELPNQEDNVNEISWARANVLEPRYPAICLKIGGFKYSARLFWRNPPIERRRKEQSTKYNICLNSTLSSFDLAVALQYSLRDFFESNGLDITARIVSVDTKSSVVLETNSDTIDVTDHIFGGWATGPDFDSASTIFIPKGFPPILNPGIASREVGEYRDKVVDKISPFMDNVELQDPFFNKVSDLGIDISDHIRTRDAVRIEIPLDIIKTTTLGYVTGTHLTGDNFWHNGFLANSLNPVGYFNFSNKSWESITTHENFLNDPISTQRTMQNSDGTQKYNIAISGSIQDYVKSLPFAFGPGQGFTIQSKLSSSNEPSAKLANSFGHNDVGDLYDAEFRSYARPMSTFGFPFDDKFRPSKGQSLNLGEYIDNDFLLTGFQVILSSSIRDSVVDGLGYSLSHEKEDFLYDDYEPAISIQLSSPPVKNGSLSYTVGPPEYTGTVVTSVEYVSGSMHAGEFSDAADKLDVTTAAKMNSIIGNDTFVGGSTQKMSFSVWVYKTADGGGNLGRIFSFGGDDIMAYSDSAEKVYFSSKWNSGNVVEHKTTTTAFHLNVWTHIVITYDATHPKNKPRIYVDGVEKQIVINGSGADHQTGAFSGIDGGDCIVGNNSAGSRHFVGKIAEFKLYNEIISKSKIDSLYSRTLHKQDYLPRAKLFNEIPEYSRSDLSHPVMGYLTGSGPRGSDAIEMQTTGSMVGFNLGLTDGDNWSAIRDASKLDRVYPWWRCDTFFLLREKQAVNESINSSVWLNQENIKIKATHSRRSPLNPYPSSKEGTLSSLSTVANGRNLEEFNFPENFNISSGKTQELISYAQVSYYGYVSNEFLTGSTQNYNPWPVVSDTKFVANPAYGFGDAYKFLNFVGLTAEEMSLEEDYISSGYAPNSNAATIHNLAKGYTADQQKFGSFHLTGSGHAGISRDWMSAGLGRDLNIMIGRDFGLSWLSGSNNEALGNSGRNSHYRAIPKENFKFSVPAWTYNQTLSNNMYFGGFNTKFWNAPNHTQIKNFRIWREPDDSNEDYYATSNAHEISKATKLHAGVLDVCASIKDSNTYDSNFEASILYSDLNTVDYAIDTGAFAYLSGSPSNIRLTDTNNNNYKYDISKGNYSDHILPHELITAGETLDFGYTTKPMIHYANNSGTTTGKAGYPFLRNVRVPVFWTGGSDYDTLGSSRRVRASLGNKIFSKRPHQLNNEVGFLNSHIKYTNPSSDVEVLGTEIGKSLESKKSEYLNANYEIESPYILKPKDNIILGFQVGLPGFSNAVSQWSNVGGGHAPSVLRPNGSVQTSIAKMSGSSDIFNPQYPLQSGYPRCHEATFHPYAGSKLVLYGKYIKNSTTFTVRKNENLGPNIRHEIIGNQPVLDRFDTELNSELSGSMFAEILGKSYPNHSYVALDEETGLNITRVATVWSNSRLNDVGGSPSRLFATGSVTRFMSIYDGDKSITDTPDGPVTTVYDEIFYDSLPIVLSDYIPESMILLSGSRVDISTGASYAPGTNVPDGDVDDTPDDFDPADVIGRKSGETKQPDFYIGLGAFNPETANIYHDGGNPGTLSSAEVDNYVGLTRESFAKVYNEKFVKCFVFASESLKNPNDFDPQNKRELSRDHQFGLKKPGEDEASFGILINPDSHRMIALSETRNYPNHGNVTAVEAGIPSAPGTTHDGVAQSASDLDILRGYYAGDTANGYALRGAARIGGGQTMVQTINTLTSSLKLSKHSRLTPVRLLEAVNQVDDSNFRRNSAFIFGFGTRSDRGHRYIYGNGFVPSSETVYLGKATNYRTNAANSYELTKDYWYHQYDTRITVEHPAGVKYGMMNYDRIKPKAIFSRNHYGHFRDLLEGRKFGAIVNSEFSGENSSYDTNLQDAFDGNQISAVKVTFVDRLYRPLMSGQESAKFLRSQNLDKYQRSSVPFFDHNPLPWNNEEGVHEDHRDGGGRVRKEHEITPEDVLITLEIPDEQFDLG